LQDLGDPGIVEDRDRPATLLEVEDVARPLTLLASPASFRVRGVGVGRQVAPSLT
jgi:hypothetical protein